MITIKNLSVYYAQNQNAVLKNMSLEIPNGRITLLLGPSGAGKTTLLKTIAQLTADYTGSIMIDDTENKELARTQRPRCVGYVFQQFNLFPTLTAHQNCTLALRQVLSLSAEHADEQARKALRNFGIEGLADRYPAHLSGGQQQRIALARALCLNPKNLLLDEPTSALDPKNTATLVGIIKELASHGMAIAISSQDMTFVRMIFDRAYYIEEGTVVESEKASMIFTNLEKPTVLDHNT